MQQLRGSIGDKPYKDNEGDDCDGDAYRIVDPHLGHGSIGHQAHPLADLAAKIGSKHRKDGKRRFVLIVAGKEQHQRQVDNKRIDFFGTLGAQAQVSSDIDDSHRAGKNEQSKDIVAVHTNAQEGCRYVNAKQKRSSIMQHSQYAFQHGGPFFLYSSWNICAK